MSDIQQQSSRHTPCAVLGRTAHGVCLLLWLSLPASAAHREGFETPEASWRLAESDCGAQLVVRERTFQPADVHAGAGAEHLRIVAGQGTFVHVSHEVGRARVIQELRPSLWIKANRPGLQLRARAVLPRSRDPHLGGSVTLWVEGDAYDQPGAWKQLAIRDVVLQVQRQARIKRAQQNNPDVDEREAYIDLIVLNAYGGPGVTDIWIDDLEVEGYSEALVAAPERPVGHGSWRAWEEDPFDQPLLTAPASEGQPPHLEGSVMVAGRGPIGVRMIEHHGESLAWLKSLGFNAVRLSRPPAPPLLDEARRLNLWLVAPPPHVTGRADITTAHDCVLAWDLGRGLETRDVESSRRLVQAVRNDDPRTGRPVLAEPRENLWAYRRMADVLLLGQEPLGTSLSLEDYRAQLRERLGDGPRRTPVWAMVQTEPRPEILEQLDTLAGVPSAASVEAAQIRLLVLAATEAGATGFCFLSRTPLDANDPAAQLRAATLQTVNREMSLIEPWVAGPSRLDTLETGLEGVRATIFETDRSKLIVVVQHNADEQFVTAPCPPRTVPMLISGAPPSWKAHRVTADGLTPLPSSQVGGGMRFVIPDVGRWAMAVVTDDALTVNFLARRQRQNLTPLAKLRHEVLSRELSGAEEIVNQAPTDLARRNEVQQRRDESRAGLARCQSLLDASDAAGSLLMAERAEQSLAQLRRLLWSGAADSFALRTASPLCSSAASLPLHWSLTQRLLGATWGPNSLAGGDFESVTHLRSAGWTQERTADEEFRTEVELSPDRPRQGQYSLRLRAAPIVGRTFEADVPLVRLVSAGVPVERGALVRIHGWVRIAAESSETRVLRVYDSVGGEATGVELGPAADWRPFALYRIAPRRERVQATIELLAPGEAWIDAVSVEILQGLPR